MEESSKSSQNGIYLHPRSEGKLPPLQAHLLLYMYYIDINLSKHLTCYIDINGLPLQAPYKLYRY